MRREKAARFQWVQVPPGNRSSRKQPEQPTTWPSSSLHQSGCGCALMRSLHRGKWPPRHRSFARGLTSKLHAVVDAKGLSVCLALTPGQATTIGCVRFFTAHGSSTESSNVAAWQARYDKLATKIQCARATSPAAVCSRLTSMRRLRTTAAPTTAQPASDNSPSVKLPVKSLR